MKVLFPIGAALSVVLGTVTVTMCTRAQEVGRPTAVTANPEPVGPGARELDRKMREANNLVTQGDRAFKKGDAKAARALYEQALKLSPRNPLGQVGLMRASEALGQPATLVDYRKLLYPDRGSYSTLADDPVIRMKYVLLLLEPGNGGAQHNWQEVVSLYESTARAISPSPHTALPPIDIHFDVQRAEPRRMQAMAHTILGLSATKHGHDAEAVHEYDKAVGIEPKLALTHCYRGFALTHLVGRSTEAKVEYRKAVALDGGDGSISEAAQKYLR